MPNVIQIAPPPLTPVPLLIIPSVFVHDGLPEVIVAFENGSENVLVTHGPPPQ